MANTERAEDLVVAVAYIQLPGAVVVVYSDGSTSEPFANKDPLAKVAKRNLRRMARPEGF